MTADLIPLAAIALATLAAMLIIAGRAMTRTATAEARIDCATPGQANTDYRPSRYNHSR